SHLCFFTSPPTTHIYPLSLHDALPISGLPAGRDALCQGQDARPRGFPRLCRLARRRRRCPVSEVREIAGAARSEAVMPAPARQRSEEHTSELQSLTNLVCRLLLEKKTY